MLKGGGGQGQGRGGGGGGGGGNFDLLHAWRGQTRRRTGRKRKGQMDTTQADQSLPSQLSKTRHLTKEHSDPPSRTINRRVHPYRYIRVSVSVRAGWFQLYVHVVCFCFCRERPKWVWDAGNFEEEERRQSTGSSDLSYPYKEQRDTYPCTSSSIHGSRQIQIDMAKTY